MPKKSPVPKPLDLKSKILNILEEHNLEPKILQEQHFLCDELIFNNIISSAHLSKTDEVLEIGAGLGILTQELSKKSKKVITIEIDTELKPLLEQLPKNVEVIYGNALEILPTRTDFNKIVANIPYQICEPLLNYLCTAKNLQLTILTVPLKFANLAQENPIFSSFLDIEILEEVPPQAFFPEPKVYSAVIKITPTKKDGDASFIRRKLYLQRDKKLKNSLRDTLIDLYRKRNKTLTKKQADKLIQTLNLSEIFLEKTSARISLIKYISVCNSLETLIET